MLKWSLFLFIWLVIFLTQESLFAETQATKTGPAYLIVLENGGLISADSRPIVSNKYLIFERNGKNQQLSLSSVQEVFENTAPQSKKVNRSISGGVATNASIAKPKPILHSSKTTPSKPRRKPLILTEETIERSTPDIYHFRGMEIRIDHIRCDMGSHRDTISIKISTRNPTGMELPHLLNVHFIPVTKGSKHMLAQSAIQFQPAMPGRTLPRDGSWVSFKSSSSLPKGIDCGQVKFNLLGNSSATGSLDTTIAVDIEFQ